MRLRRLRPVLAVLFALITTAIAMGPLLLWRAERADALRADLDNRLVAQMEEVLYGEVTGSRVTEHLTWAVNVNDGVAEIGRASCRERVSSPV